MYAGLIQLKPTQSQLVRSNREMGRTNWELNHTYSLHVHFSFFHRLVDSFSMSSSTSAGGWVGHAVPSRVPSRVPAGCQGGGTRDIRVLAAAPLGRGCLLLHNAHVWSSIWLISLLAVSWGPTSAYKFSPEFS